MSITEGFIRLSIGTEDSCNLKNEINKAL